MRRPPSRPAVSRPRAPRRRRPSGRTAWWACAALCAWTASSAQAPSTLPSQVLPGSLRPPADDTTTVPTETAPAPTPPASAADDAAAPRVTPARVRIDGGFPALDAAGRALEERLRGRAVSLREIQLAATDLERAYAMAGYPLARVVVPPQRLADGGTLVLRVIDGFIEAVVVDGVEAPMRQLVRERLQPLVGAHALTSAALDRAVLLAGELPGLHLRSALVRGTQEGGTRLVVEGHASALAVQARMDNALPDALGRKEASATLALDSPAGLGEQWYASLAYAPTQPGARHAALRSLGLGLVVPTSLDGPSVNLEVVRAFTSPRTAAGTLATEGDYQRWSLRATQPLLREHKRRIDGYAAIDDLSQSLVASDFGVDLNRDHYRSLRLGATSTLAAGRVSMRLDVSGDAGLGGRGADEVAASGVPTSRPGAAPHFAKAGFAFDVIDERAAGWQVALHAQGQATRRPLLTPETFAMASPDTLSAFDTGALDVDTGLLARLQAGRRLASPAQPAVSWLAYGFAALAHGHVFDPTSVQAASVSAEAAGVGLRATHERGDGRSLALGLEAAMGHADGRLPAHVSRISISVEFQL